MKIWLKILFVFFGVILFIILVAFLFLFFYPGVGSVPNQKMREEYQKKTSYFYDDQFHNSENFELTSGVYEENVGAVVRPKQEVPVITWDNYPNASEEEFQINWLGHSSSLIQMNGANILIDPVLTEYASPVGFMGSKRFSKVALLPENVPHIDVLLISHDHYDHLDYQTISQIDSKVDYYLVLLGVESYLKSFGVASSKIYSLGWWEQREVHGIIFTSVPAQHYSGRNPLKKNATWWCGYHFTDGNHSLYFTGDSGYGSHFQEIKERLGKIDVMMADSGQYNTMWSKIHMRPNETLQAAKDVDASYLIPVHWGAFVLSNHDWNASPKIATHFASEYGVSVITPKIGERVDYRHILDYQESWWDFD